MAAAIIRNVGSTCADSEGCLVLVMPCGSVVTSHDYSCAAAAAAAAVLCLVAAHKSTQNFDIFKPEICGLQSAVTGRGALGARCCTAMHRSMQGFAINHRSVSFLAFPIAAISISAQLSSLFPCSLPCPHTQLTLSYLATSARR
jgi:hypothetical protein